MKGSTVRVRASASLICRGFVGVGRPNRAAFVVAGVYQGSTGLAFGVGVRRVRRQSCSRCSFVFRSLGRRRTRRSGRRRSADSFGALLRFVLKSRRSFLGPATVATRRARATRVRVPGRWLPVLDRQRSLASMLRTCMSTVRGLRKSWWAISRLVRPTATRRRISSSLRVRPPCFRSRAARRPRRMSTCSPAASRSAAARFANGRAPSFLNVW